MEKFHDYFDEEVDYQRLIDKIDEGLKGEENESFVHAKEIVHDFLKPYRQKTRKRWNGPLSIDGSVELDEDFYAYSFLYNLKRRYIFNDEEESEDEANAV